MRSQLLTLAILAVPIASSAGCCTMARLFCGPDRSPWVSISFRSPEHAVRTLLEALRRDDAEAVYLCLSNRYRADLGVDNVTMQLAWPKLREQVPGLHLAGYAEIPEPQRRDANHVHVAIDVAGYVIDIELERESYWQVRYVAPSTTDPFGAELTSGGQVSSFDGVARIETLETGDDDLEERSRLTLSPFEFSHNAAEVPLDRVDFAGLFREWKVLHLSQRTD